MLDILTLLQHLDREYPHFVYLRSPLLSQYTTMKVGGEAPLMLIPQNISEIILMLTLCQEYYLPYFILGKGSNLIVNDEGVDLVLISMTKLDRITVNPADSTLITAEAGVSMEALAAFALKYERKGLEFAHGIPGTVGGGVFMNAGAYGGEIKDVLVSSLVLDLEGCQKVLSRQEHQFSYRKSRMSQSQEIILQSSFRLEKGKSQDISALMQDLKDQRKSKQPLEFPSAGSVFKRPEGYFVGKLLTDAGLKGYTIGGASVSEKHAGFIINTGKAKSQDILDLIAHIQKTIKHKFNVYLEPEVKFLEKDGTFRIF